MNNKLFIGLLIGILVVGASVGGAFAGGVAYGRGQEDTTPVVAASALPSPSGSQVGVAPPGGADITNLRQRFQSGDITPDELQQLRNRFQGEDGGGRQAGFGGFGGRGGGSRLGGGGGFTGTIESVVDGVVTVNTQQGPLQATLVADTIIRSIVEVSVEDLVLDTSVTITVHTTEDGLIEASSVLITPDGFGFGGEGRFFDGSQDDSHQSP